MPVNRVTGHMTKLTIFSPKSSLDGTIGLTLGDVVKVKQGHFKLFMESPIFTYSCSLPRELFKTL